MTMGTVTGRWSRNDVVGTGQGAVPPKEDVLLASCTVQTKRRVAHYISTKYFKEVLEHLKQISYHLKLLKAKENTVTACLAGN